MLEEPGFWESLIFWVRESIFRSQVWVLWFPEQCVCVSSTVLSALGHELLICGLNSGESHASPAVYRNSDLRMHPEKKANNYHISERAK